MIRRVLTNIPEARYCPAPDCGYAVLASNCSKCPMLTCMRVNCKTYFCFNCRDYWHAGLTCEESNSEKITQSISDMNWANSAHSHHDEILLDESSPEDILSIRKISTEKSNEIKPCPKCNTLIIKMDDGSCNHIKCSMCGIEFCWLCMREINDFHYLSPSGCTFWGKKKWTRKKTNLWRLGAIFATPVVVGIIGALSIPVIIVGLPIYAGLKVHNKYKSSNKHKRRAFVVGTVSGVSIISPAIAVLTVLVLVPVSILTIYGLVIFSFKSDTLDKKNKKILT